MMLPRHEESEEQIIARLPKAVERQFDVDLIEQGLQERPGQCRECVFDFKDGIRMVVSRDRKDLMMCLHFSFSGTDKWIVQNQIRDRQEYRNALTEHAAKTAGRLAPIIANSAKLADVMLSPKDVVHLMFEDE